MSMDNDENATAAPDEGQQEAASEQDEPEVQDVARRRKRKEKELQVRRKKEFTYRGFSLEQLQKMSSADFLKLLPSRSRRSLKKGYTEDQKKLMERFNKTGGASALRTHNRDLVITPQFVGKRFAIHNGKEFVEVTIAPEMLGHFLGEFVLTRKSVKHTGPGVGATRSSKFMPLK